MQNSDLYGYIPSNQIIQSSNRQTASGRVFYNLEKISQWIAKLKSALTVIIEKLNPKRSHLRENVKIWIQLNRGWPPSLFGGFDRINAIYCLR